ncbi:protein AGENET DOMAIN (AGD)-CONTAINING P1-like [Salvia splendens]|uniref:protein AGENET DOMAIN (AGD)-CONTAINING P1-like n=1 Tax=Salvia splendens TaxID=180675 RepID=UPI001C264E7B|nr:protein AGENET DOMAIN (AGD)-CONTAINING P1-like [Salvia splendens]
MGSYFEATVVADLAKDGYMVHYRTLLKEDLSGPLREVASAAEVRPRPPQDLAAWADPHPLLMYISASAPSERYRMNDVVDGFDKEGWWWGRITGRRGDSYSVFFETTGDEIFYHKNLLRTHQEWTNGRWSLAMLIPIGLLINLGFILL